MSRQVLLIEPDTVLAKTYLAALQHTDFEVRVAADAQSAIHIIDTAKQPELIILELQLAAHNGVEFLYELRSYPEWQNIPVIILSQVPRVEAGINDKIAHKLGIKKYCYKPQTSLKQLIDILDSQLDKVKA